MSLDKLKRYRVNPGYTEGVIIMLDDVPEVEFKVRLPGGHNRAYIAEVYQSLELSLDGEESVNVKAGVIEARERQEQAFLKHCLLSIDGEPAPDNFATEYPEALEELMLKANQAAEAYQKSTQRAIELVTAYLTWEHRWGGKLEFYDRLEKAGRVDEGDLKPDIGPYQPILSAFWELSTERQVGMAIGPIPASAITEYLEKHDLPYWWDEVIVAADNTMLKLTSAKAKAKSDAA